MVLRAYLLLTLLHPGITSGIVRGGGGGSCGMPDIEPWVGLVQGKQVSCLL